MFLLVDDPVSEMTRSHTCHDNPLFLSDDNTQCIQPNAKEDGDTSDHENIHSTNSINSNLPTHQQIEESEESLELNGNTRHTKDGNVKAPHISGVTFGSPPNNGVDGRNPRCTLCILSRQNQNQYIEDEYNG